MYANRLWFINCDSLTSQASQLHRFAHLKRLLGDQWVEDGRVGVGDLERRGPELIDPHAFSEPAWVSFLLLRTLEPVFMLLSPPLDQRHQLELPGNHTTRSTPVRNRANPIGKRVCVIALSDRSKGDGLHIPTIPSTMTGAVKGGRYS